MQRLEQKAALDSARSLDSGGQKSEAEAEYQRLAEGGYVDATFAVHLSLRGREEAGDQALYWLRIAAKQIDLITPGLLPDAMSAALQKDSSLDLKAQPWSEDEPDSDLESLADAYLDLGLTFIEAGRDGEGERLIEQAAEMGWTPADYHWGLILLNRGETLEAEPWIRRAAENGWDDAVEQLGEFRERSEQLDSKAVALQEPATAQPSETFLVEPASFYKHPQHPVLFLINPPEIRVFKLSFEPAPGVPVGPEDLEEAEVLGSWMLTAFEPGVWTQLYDGNQNPLPVTLNVQPPATVYAAWY